MSEEENIAGLQTHIAVLRERAAQARRLAKEITDRLACDGLAQHAQELERRAEQLEARLATLRQPTGRLEDIVALKPLGREPDIER